MNQLNEIIVQLNKKGYNSYFFGSYVYNYLLQNYDHYNDIDIMTENVDLLVTNLYDKFKKCVILGNEVNHSNRFVQIKCEGLEKKLDILNLTKNNSILLSKRWDNIFDFQRIIYDGEKFFTLDKTINIKELINEIKKNQIRYFPKNLKPKYVYLKQKFQ